ncbi:hypothetical protein BKA93DRAFT_775721 [Sparassis latifolia]|uniref:Protein pet117, mitochondrial n=1 Tax=Sparassis crispa TaxID=139825 RepID=A0A401GVZ2_9APHY|nr:Protein pet117, mitochondrial [Sparassis crispa]GBE86352.1 Protein pet117, mitochondrial [Sparassis crispa]
MSRAAKATLIGSVFASAFIIWGVHHLQTRERETMYKGVIRDDERRREKMRQREEDLHESLRKREIYERVQPVSSSATRDSGQL